MASVKRARGKKSVAISDRSGFKVPYTSLKTTWDGLRVEPEEYEPKHPQLTPPRNVVDATALFDPRPDNDPENVEINIGFTFDPFIDAKDRPGVGVPGFGRVGFVADIHFDRVFNVTGVAGTGAVGTVIISDNEDVSVTGVAGTGAIGAEVPESEAGVTGVAGTGAIGTVTSESEATPSGVAGTAGIGTVSLEIFIQANPTGVAGTGAVGTEVVRLEVNETGVAGTGAVGTVGNETEKTPTGVAGTGAIGSEVPESEVNPTGVAGTGAAENFGVAGNGNVQITVTGVSGIAGTGAVGIEEAVSEVIETGIAGTGAIGTVEIQIDYGWGEGTWGSGEWGE